MKKDFLKNKKAGRPEPQGPGAIGGPPALVSPAVFYPTASLRLHGHPSFRIGIGDAVQINASARLVKAINELVKAALDFSKVNTEIRDTKISINIHECSEQRSLDIGNRTKLFLREDLQDLEKALEPMGKNSVTVKR